MSGADRFCNPGDPAHFESGAGDRCLDPSKRRKVLSLYTDDPTNQVRASPRNESVSFVCEASQCLQVHYVLSEVFAFRCFEHLRNFAEPAIAHDKSESIETDSAFADVFMPIYSRTAGGFGIVEVNRGKTIPPNHPIEFAKALSQRRFVPDVVTGGENMRGVEANTQAFRLAHAADDVCKLLEFVSQACSLACSCLQC